MVDSPPPPSPSPTGRGDTHMPQANPTRRADPPWTVERTIRSPPASHQDPATTPPPSQPMISQDVSQLSNLQPRLPISLIRSPRPAGGFPAIHLSTPPWYNLQPDQRAHFDLYPEPKFWVRGWQGSKKVDLVIASEDLKGLILRMTGEKAKLLSPQQEKDIASNKRGECQKPPYHFLVSRISEQAYAVILNNPIISMAEATAFFLPYSPAVPRFLCTIEGFTLSVKDADAIWESEDEVTCIVRDSLLSNDAFIALLKSKLIGDTTLIHNMKPATSIISTLAIHFSKPEVLANAHVRLTPTKPLWNIYSRDDLPVMWTSYFLLLQSLCSVTFDDMDYGSATLVAEAHRLHCFNCKGADHEQFNCAYATLDGWYANANTEARIEETAVRVR
ncbi:hypothetical protein J132_09037 [Termitomyces sp. J132]|nr:hypothetical protein H2248_004944 [Termitomyces sp. 'cryptogamus']KNZ73962.1 hypothetical protein J132_09037 [Termitomyces sp. J132]